MAGSLERPELKTLKKYIPGKPIEEVQREYGLAEVVKLASNENPLGTSPKAIAAMQAELAKLNLYPESTCPELTEAVAARLGMPPESLLFDNGGDAILSSIAQAFVNPGDEAIMANPSFVSYPTSVQIMSGRCVLVPLDADYRHDLPAMAAAITPRTKLIYVCNPNNPTGTIVTKRETDWLLERVPEHALVVFDEAYYDFVENPEYPQTLEYVREGRNVIVVRTFSKIYGLAGVRVGYAVARPDLIDSLAKVREVFAVDRVAQAGARAALTDEEFRQRTIAVNSAGKRYLYERFQSLGRRYVPTDANFVWVDLGVDTRIAFDRLLRRGVIVRPGFIWDYPTWARVTIGTQAENEKFIAALSDVLEEMLSSQNASASEES